ncbi:hypothetical protein JCM10450v2_002397 [Rhodotorula kratochvilovae]
MSSLFPAIQPFKSELLPVSDLHKISVKQFGKPDGQSVLFVHGGPGGGCDPRDAQRFDPSVYHITLVDQRGSGDSLPAAELEENTTWDLVEDFEKVRKHLGVDKWHVFGGSWGSTLGLAYAQTHPDRVKSLTLRGIFTLRREELQFFYQSGTSFLFPDFWEEYLAPIPEAERGDLIAAYHKRLTSSDAAVRAEAARAWSRWEMATSRLQVNKEYLDKAEDGAFADAFARIEAHYFQNGGFLPRDGFLLEQAQIDKIRHIPAVIVQGRYDVVCPARTAWDLHRAWPEAKLVIVPDAGHSAMEAGTERALLDATAEFAKLP